MGYPTLTFQTDGQLATIALTRPEKRNAISAQMVLDLMAALDQAETSSARVVILTGSGKAFCAGMDLEELQALATHSLAKHLEDARRIARMFYRLYSFPKPVIAAVNGAAIAGGCGLATLADITLCVPEAKFGYTEVRIGFLPALVAVFLRRQVGEKHARELLLTGKIIDASEAFRLGLVNEVVSSGDLMDRAREVADSILEGSPTSVLRTKKMFHLHDEKVVRGELELAIEANAEIRLTEDFREGVASFLEKRPPRWRNGD
ncbi:MAG TPA: enoyl-CoA hydratase-related protein [Candidatus Aquilonibacter sp.]|nr:enoyl-CoA hydratase-related protein [Candidatus Aquilonibacter sp.]